MCGYDKGVCACMQLELVLTAATLCIAIVGVISGLFGMNLTNTHEGSYTAFILVRAPSLSLKHVLASVPRLSGSSCARIVCHACVKVAFACEDDDDPCPQRSGSKHPLGCAVQVSTLSSAFAILLFISIVAFCRWKKLF